MPAPRTGKTAVVAIMLVAFVVGISAAVSQVWTRLQVIDYGYKLSRVNKENARLLEANRRLRIEYALLKNPSHIATVARKELGMKPPAPEQVRRLRGSRRKKKATKLAARGKRRRP